jgi:hypothetical protein
MKHTIIRRENGTKLFLSPFLDEEEVVGWGEQPIEIAVADEADSGIKEDALYLLYTYIDRAVDSWVQELKYIPRLINSALTFLIVYFFFSFVIRDPLPMVDEIILASGAAAAVYLWTAGRNRKSDIARKRRTELKLLADSAEITHESTAGLLEQRLRELDGTDLLQLSEQVSGAEGELEKLDLSKDEREQMGNYLLLLLNERDRNKKVLRKLYERTLTSSEREKLSARFYVLSKEGKIDLPLIGLYQSIR